MKELLPNNILNTIYFSLSSQECLDTSSGQPESTQSNTLTYGQILKEGKCACLTNGSTLEIVSLDSGDRKAAWNFYSSNSKESIVCFCSCGGKLIIALKCLDTYPVGKLCIFDPGTSKILKTIHLNYVPTCVAAVREFGGIGSNSASMRYAFLIIFWLPHFFMFPIMVGNKAKSRISKWLFQENKACQISQKTNIS